MSQDIEGLRHIAKTRYHLEFSRESDQVWEETKKRAKILNVNYIGTEHLLFGLVQDPYIRSLLSHYIEVDDLESSLDFKNGKGQSYFLEKLPLTSRTWEVGIYALQSGQIEQADLATPLDFLKGIIIEGRKDEKTTGKRSASAAYCALLDRGLSPEIPKLLQTSHHHELAERVRLVLEELYFQPQQRNQLTRDIYRVLTKVTPQ